MGMQSVKIRSLAWFAITAQALFVASWLVAGALEPGFSQADGWVSALASSGAEHAWIVMAGLAVLGLGAIALAAGLAATLPPRPARTVAATLFALIGTAFVISAFARLDCNAALTACDGAVHAWAGFLALLFLLATPFALGRALWPSPTAAVAMVAALAGLGIAILGQIAYDSGGADGTTERIELFVAQLWFLIVAAGLL